MIFQLAAPRLVTQSLRFTSRRCLSFSFAGPRTLAEILKKDLIQDKAGSEVAKLWATYHEEKEDVVGIVLQGDDGKSVLSRANKCPFFVQPVFRDNGFFMMVSQFQAPSHFLLAYLEDYKMDPQAASPLLTFSVFDDYAETKDLALVRCDILNRSIQMQEGRKVVASLLDNYLKPDEFGAVQAFNERPDSFDIDDFISRMNDRWNRGDTEATV